MNKHLVLLLLLLITSHLSNAQEITGTVKDQSTGETIIGATVLIKGTTTAVSTDENGKFVLNSSSALPLKLVVSFIGYEPAEVNVTSYAKTLGIKLKQKKIELSGAEVQGSRISEKQKEAPLTVESIDRIAIKECAQTSFYEALGTLKGVDLTSASLGFTIINTRGFNSTSPVRSLQLIDGVDNQSPGLNFSLGNFLGSPELDVLKVDLIAGASTAYYGPSAFNGVISMTTRSPFINPGLEVTAKAGEQQLGEVAVRWSQVFKNKKGDDKFAYKLNLYFMRANDWEADNHDETIQSRNDIYNPGRYDAVNKYGDEYSIYMDQSKIPLSLPGCGTYYRTGYWEKDLVDYNTHNLKAGAALHYKVNTKDELIFSSNFGNGTTVYQGDNRYALKDILFFQNRLEYKRENKFFIRAYATNENAGNSYDAYFTALKMQQSATSDDKWALNYTNYWNSNYSSYIKSFPGFPVYNPNNYPSYIDYVNSIYPFLYNNYYDSLVLFHQTTEQYVNDYIGLNQNPGYYEPGTALFDSAYQSVTTNLFTEGGSRFYDKSALYHAQGEYIFTPEFMQIVVGGNGRLYRPDSKGTIFEDTGNVVIQNYEVGFYTGLEKKLVDEKLKLNLTARIDKNENFDALISPALSAVYTFNQKQIVRASFSSAVRNPTLADQYLYYRVSPLILLIGNLNGFDSLVTVPSLFAAINSLSKDSLKYFNVAPIRPEQVKTVEIGYRTTLFNNLYMDLVAYYSWYKNFIGYKVGATYEFQNPFIIPQKIYRVAANAEDIVTTRGVSVGLNYFFRKFFTLNVNYSYNKLDRMGSDDPLIPAYNTPENKFNVGLSARDIDTYIFKKIHLKNIGFSVNFKWVQEFLYEGSPQFTGYVPSYYIVDAQVSYQVKKLKSTFKLGASNLLNNKIYTVYGGPEIGRLAYISIYVDLTN